jgi:hypothetical protein
MKSTYYITEKVLTHSIRHSMLSSVTQYGTGWRVQTPFCLRKDSCGN